MVTIFTRSITDDLASLVKEIDSTVAKNDSKKMAAFVVLLSDDPKGDEAKLKALAEKHGIEKTPLTIYPGTDGPRNYKIADDAEVTVLMWQKTKVKANHAFKKGELNKDAIKKVVGATSSILN